MSLLIIFCVCLLTHASFAVREKSNGHFARMLGGHDAQIEERPYQAQLNIHNSVYCGASILNKNTILTAAHCVSGISLDTVTLNVAVGSVNLYEGEMHTVSAAFIHPDYQLFQVGAVEMARNDIAVLKLTKDLKFNPRVEPINLQSKNLPVPAGTIAIATGWGLMNESNIFSAPNTLQELEMEVISNENCNKRYSKVDFGITDDLLCAFTPSKGACYGDSGGPLVVGDRIIGVMSSVITCGDLFFPTTLANVSNLHDFIAKHL